MYLKGGVLPKYNGRERCFKALSMQSDGSSFAIAQLINAEGDLGVFGYSIQTSRARLTMPTATIPTIATQATRPKCSLRFVGNCLAVLVTDFNVGNLTVIQSSDRWPVVFASQTTGKDHLRLVPVNESMLYVPSTWSTAGWSATLDLSSLKMQPPALSPQAVNDIFRHSGMEHLARLLVAFPTLPQDDVSQWLPEAARSSATQSMFEAFYKLENPSILEAVLRSMRGPSTLHSAPLPEKVFCCRRKKDRLFSAARVATQLSQSCFSTPWLKLSSMPTRLPRVLHWMATTPEPCLTSFRIRASRMDCA